MTLRYALVFLTLSAFLASLQVFATSTNGYDCLNSIDQELRRKLSPRASIVHDPTVPSRYSSYYAPQPGVVVNVAEEKDVIETVKYCIKNNLKFLVQSGGHGWATTFNIGSKDLVINMRGLNQVRVSDTKDKLTFGGGALVGEVREAAYQNQVVTTVPTCNCVGMSGATLGGGYNVLMGRYGFVIDNILSINLVTAEGKLMTVTPESSPDLWWALRGAGANFGVVTSVTMKTYPQINNGIGWLGTLSFSPDRLEDLIQILSDFDYPKEMFILLHFRPNQNYAPSIMVDVVYSGSQAAAKASLKPLYDLEPLAEISQEVPFNQLGAIADLGCTKGLRIPSYGVGLKKLDPKTFVKIWNEYLSLIPQNPGLLGTVVTIEAFSTKVARQFPDSSSAFPYRNVNFIGLISSQYLDAALDPIIEDFGTRVRQMMQQSSGYKDPKVYVNYGHGDEDLKEIYGESLSRLKKLKKKWDRNGHFSQFFPIPRQ